MRKRFEGGSTMFSDVVEICVRYDLFETEQGEKLLELCSAHGADWMHVDGWGQTAFRSLLDCCLTSREARRGRRSTLENVKVVRGVLERHPEPWKLWNGTEKRGDNEPCAPRQALKLDETQSFDSFGESQYI